MKKKKKKKTPLLLQVVLIVMVVLNKFIMGIFSPPILSHFIQNFPLKRIIIIINENIEINVDDDIVDAMDITSVRRELS